MALLFFVPTSHVCRDPHFALHWNTSRLVFPSSLRIFAHSISRRLMITSAGLQSNTVLVVLVVVLYIQFITQPSLVPSQTKGVIGCHVVVQTRPIYIDGRAKPASHTIILIRSSCIQPWVLPRNTLIAKLRLRELNRSSSSFAWVGRWTCSSPRPKSTWVRKESHKTFACSLAWMMGYLSVSGALTSSSLGSWNRAHAPLLIVMMASQLQKCSRDVSIFRNHSRHLCSTNGARSSSSNPFFPPYFRRRALQAVGRQASHCSRVTSHSPRRCL